MDSEGVGVKSSCEESPLKDKPTTALSKPPMPLPQAASVRASAVSVNAF